jgi:AcrR family transcriptional regulator
MDAAPGKRRARADDTRRRLFVAARTLFESRGYGETTVDAIARKAGVAKGTFFLHFPTKAHVVTELVRIQTDKALAAADTAWAEGARASLREAVVELGRQAGASRMLSRAVIAATLEELPIGDTTARLFDRVLLRMTSDARAAGAAEPHTLARALMTAYLGAVLHFTTTTSTPPLLELLVPLVDSQLEEVPHAPEKPAGLRTDPHRLRGGTAHGRPRRRR